DGNTVSFTSGPVADTHVLVRDRRTGVTELVDQSSDGMPGNGSSTRTAVSADARFVAFDSIADNLVPNDSNGVSDVFVRDRVTGMIERVSVGSLTCTDGDRVGQSCHNAEDCPGADCGAPEGNGASGAPSISADGQVVTFVSTATNLVPGVTDGFEGVYVHD